MPPAAIALLAVSAIAHAAWNMLGKRRQPTLGFFGAAEGAMAVIGLAAWPWALPLLAQAPGRFWLLLLASCACQAGYYAALAAAYRRNDLSAAYPLLRAMPVVLLAAVAGSLGWKPLGGSAIAGIACVVGGCLLVPLAAWGAWRRGLAGLAQPCMAAAILFSTTFAAIDAALVRLAGGTAGSAAVLAVAAVMVVGNALGCLLLALALPAERRLLAELPRELPRAAMAGVGVWLSYGTLLLALPMVGNPSFAAAFRQLSIPLGVLLGVTCLRERPSWPRSAGVAGILAGLVLVAGGSGG